MARKGMRRACLALAKGSFTPDPARQGTVRHSAVRHRTVPDLELVGLVQKRRRVSPYTTDTNDKTDS